MKTSNNPAVSILVPVYNVQAYLNQCLDSIVSQSFPDWECILVDDGSADKSGHICDEYAARDNRFRVIHTKNGGVSSARNVGIQESKGEYIMFCDSDDWLDPGMVESMHRLITEHNADIAQVGFWREYDGYSQKNHLVKNTIVLDRQSAFRELARDRIIPSYMWNKMFRREIIGPDFPVGKTFEDIFTGVKWFGHINRIVCAPILLYHYRMRRESIVHCSSPDYRVHYIDAVRYRADEILKAGLDTISGHDKCILKASVSGAKIIARREEDKGRRERYITEISKRLRDVGCPGVAALGPKLWLRATLLRRCPKFFSRLIRVENKTKTRPRKLYD